MNGIDIWLRMWAWMTIATGLLLCFMGPIWDIGWWTVATGAAGGMLIGRGWEDWRREVAWTKAHR